MALYLAKTISYTNAPRHVLGALFFAGCALLGGTASVHAQEQLAPAGANAIEPQVAAPVVNKKRVTPTIPSVKAPSKPDWSELTPSQQQALAPLAASWAGVDEPRKRKWLAISQNFASLPPQEQTRMHSRMKEWAALSPQERIQARLNFAGARELPSDKRLEKWEAYQALPPEQRQHLAATAPGKPTGAATAVKPAPINKQALSTPQSAASAPKLTSTGLIAPAKTPTPKIATGLHQIDKHTLLPIPQVATPEATKQP